MGVGADCCLDVRVTQPALHISRIPPSSEKGGRMGVTEYVRRCLQPSPLRELPEEIDHGRIPHWRSDLAAPPVHEDIVVRSFSIFMNEVVRIKSHRRFRDMHHIRRARLSQSAVAICAGYDVDCAVVGADVGMAKPQSLPDSHSALMKKTQQQTIPQPCTRIQQRLNFDRREHARKTLDRSNTNDRMAKGLCPADVVQERLVRTLSSIAPRATDRSLHPKPVLVLVERTDGREDQIDRGIGTMVPTSARCMPHPAHELR